MQNEVIKNVKSTLEKMAKGRCEIVLSQEETEKRKDRYDILLRPLTYQSNDTIYYGLQLPQCFPTMTSPDILSILEWHVQEGSTVRPGQDLVEVHAKFGDIVIPLFAPRGTYRIIQMMKAPNEQVQLGELLIILQMVVHQPSRQKTARQNAA
jgi:hypothetical protein